MKKYLVRITETQVKETWIEGRIPQEAAEDAICNYSKYDWEEVGEPETEVVEIVEENFRKGTL